jgi:Asp/Glu/hydantoin racemase
MSRRRFLIINPNTSEATTRRLANALTPLAPSDVALEFRTARFGASYIACEASHAVAGHALLDAWAAYRAENSEQLDGVLIGCFGDPGLFALRESAACKITGLAEASMQLAAAHGSFAIVTGGERWRAMLERLALSLGHASALKHVEIVAPTGAQLQADPALAIACLSDACKRAASSGAKAVILGGAGLAGYAKELASCCPVPLIDSAEAGLKVLLDGLAPAPTRKRDGFVADWQQLPVPMLRLLDR